MAARRRRALGIRTSIALAICTTVASTVLGAAAVYGYQLYRVGQHAEHLRLQAIAETYAQQITPLLTINDGAGLPAFIEHLPCHPATSLLAVVGGDGIPLVVRGSEAILQRYLAVGRNALPLNRPVVWDLSTEPGSPIANVHVAAIPINSSGPEPPLAIVVYAGQSSGESGVTAGQVWTFFACLMLIAVTGIILGWWYLKFTVIAPLAALSQGGKKHGPGHGENDNSLATERNDEIGRLAQSLSKMRLDLEQWREKSSRLQHHMDRRVNSATAKITRELHQTQRKAWTDALTRLGNRRLLDEKLGEIFSSQQAANQDLAIVMFDVDNFKKLNDTRGHKAGDELLIFIGELLRQCVREEDLAIRLGGDEFALILPAVSATNAKAVSERTIRLFSQRARLLDVEPKPTMSAGVASLTQHRASSAEGLLQMADHALYAAKRAGKSAVTIYDPKRHVSK